MVAMAYCEIRVWPHGAANWVGPPRAEREVGPPPTRLQVGPGGRAVDEDDRLGHARLQGGDGVADHHLPRGTPHLGRVEVGGPKPEVLGHLDRSQRAQAAGVEAVDVVPGEAGVGQRPGGRLEVQLVGRLVVDPPDVGQRRPDDGDASVTLRSFRSSAISGAPRGGSTR